jgi:hypothetical protein
MDDQSNNISEQENDHLAGDAEQSMGEPEVQSAVDAEPRKDSSEDLPAFAKERLGRQEKRHKRELRELRQQMQHLMQSQQPMGSPNTAPPEQMNTDGDQIQRAVQAALMAKDQQMQQQKEAEKAQHVYKQYQNLENHLDSVADKYDDFDEVVRGNDVPFTPAMRDTSLLLDNAGDVLYKLGKNPDELKRISQLHPLDQAKEMIKLSTALMQGNSKSGSQPKTIGQIKSNPVSSQQITENTSPADIRARMKAGNFK